MKPTVQNEQLPTIIHCGPIYENTIFMETTQSRINKAIELYKLKFSKPLIFSAGSSYCGITQSDGWEEMIKLIPTSEFNFVDAMKKELIHKGVNPKDFITENLGLDTVGEIYFIVEKIIKPNNFKKFRVITNEFHMNRCIEIYQKLLGKNFNIILEPAFSKMDTTLELKKRVQKRELSSLKTFNSTFKNVSPGDEAKFEETLYSKHKRYCNLPNNEKIKFYKKD
jgi:hypothetical protein